MAWKVEQQASGTKGVEDDHSMSRMLTEGGHDLEVVCQQLPWLPPSGPTAGIVDVVNSALKGVGSHIGLADLTVGHDSATATIAQRPLPVVKTSPVALYQDDGAELPLAGTFARSVSCEGLNKKHATLSGNIRELGLPPLLMRRRLPSSTIRLPATKDEPGESSAGISTGLTPSSGHGSLADFDSGSKFPSTSNLGGHSQSHAGAWPRAEDEATSRSSILDFEHLFAQYYVELRPHRRWHHGRSLPSVSVLPSADEVLSAWKMEAADYIWRHSESCRCRWPGLKFTRAALERQLDVEVMKSDELLGPKSRIVLTLEPERVSHRLLWAIGDAIPPSYVLSHIQNGLQMRWPQCRVRCSDDLLYPASVFRITLLFFTVVLVCSLRALTSAVQILATAPVTEALGRKSVRQQADFMAPTREERLDQLCARVLVLGCVAKFWLLHAVAASFPLRSLHSPFKRDLGCLAAYSPTALWLLRVFGPLAELTVPVAMAIRFQRLGLPPIASIFGALGRPAWWLPAGALLCSASIPVLSAMAAWSVRSSLYSHHQLFMMLLFLAHLGYAFSFAAYFEMVRWVVYSASAWVMGGLLLFHRYTAEFTSASLDKAAQLQWACAHVVAILGLLLALALEVESGVARVLVDFICEAQDFVPTALCIRFLREASK